MEDKNQEHAQLPEELESIIEKINNPDKSFDDTTKADGSLLSEDEKIALTRNFMRSFCTDFLKMGMAVPTIMEQLESAFEANKYIKEGE